MKMSDANSHRSEPGIRFHTPANRIGASSGMTGMRTRIETTTVAAARRIEIASPIRTPSTIPRLATIDPAAKFSFVQAVGYRKKKGEIRFDMFDAEYTHVGALCTFEVLVESFGLRRDEALRALGEIVHDIDFKDDAFGRPGTKEVDAELKRIYARYSSDYERLDVGGALFENLYAMLGGN